MRTKTLLLTAATVVAGLTSSMAQSNVFSVNVVGYVNATFPAGALVLVANPLDGGTNDLNTILPNVPAKSTAQFWTGSGFTISTKGGPGPTWSTDNVIPPGVGFFVNAKTAYTNTYVGSVLAPVGGSVTNPLPAGLLVLVASQIPYSGDINNTNFNADLPAKSTAQFWTGSGFTISTKGAPGPTWSGVNPVAVGQGFFLNAKSAYNWSQTLPAN